MLEVAVTICEKGYCRLNQAFSHVSPEADYSAERARRKMLQMPLASVRIGKPHDGKSFIVLVESFPGIEKATISHMLNGLIDVTKAQNPSHLERSCVKMLLSLAQSDRERNTLRYTIFKASGMSQTEARRRYGFEQMNMKAAKVEAVIVEIREIREAIESLARIQDRALLQTYGIEDAFSSSDESCSDTEELDIDPLSLEFLSGETRYPVLSSPPHLSETGVATRASERPPYMSAPTRSYEPEELPWTSTLTGVSQPDQPSYVFETDVATRASERPPYMSAPSRASEPKKLLCTSAPTGVSQPDQPSYMFETEGATRASEGPPYLSAPTKASEPEKLNGVSQPDQPSYVFETDVATRASERPPYMSAPSRASEPEKLPCTSAPTGVSQPYQPPYISEMMSRTGTCESENLSEISLPSEVMLKTILLECRCNWFEFQDRFSDLFQNISYSQQDSLLEKVYEMLSQLDLSCDDMRLITQSYLAAKAAKADQAEDERLAHALNGEIVTDSESDNPDDYTHLRDPLSVGGKEIIKKRRTSLRRRTQRLKAKAIAGKRFLSRKYTKRSSRVIQDCPDIGKTIEAFVEESNVGADHWRRTGVLTFDGNARLNKKVTYRRIQKHLEKVYNRHFAYGTVVELCVPRNRRRRSALRYRGLAHVTTRRARKGFNVRYNPDTHWSCALYKGLNDMQLKDGRELTVLNRDDASGFRLDTLVTCKQYATPAVQGHDIVTTRCDYVNKYPSVLQVTSYNFSATGTTAEICAGVVKAPGSYPKNPAQHAADLDMLEKELGAAFEDQAGNCTPIDCIRVDGATDEGPSHEEVQFWWTRRHLLRSKVATLVTTRSSGSSYLNRVELQNGCLSLAHSNTFIPSTLGGSCVDPQTGTIDQTKLKENLDLAIDAYICRVDGCPCGTTTISLYKGADSSNQQLMRDKLLIFLKGTVQAKDQLREDNPQLFSEFQSVWEVRRRHMVVGLPQQYLFFLLCCYQPDCQHPRCQAGRPDTPYRWYPQGPLITQLPLPAADPKRPWGSSKCTTCKGFCSGHYSSPTYIDVTSSTAFVKPPSTVLKELLLKNGDNITDDFVKSAAQSTLLTPEEAKIWIQHLQVVVENRRRGAKKAAQTRKAKKASDTRSQASVTSSRDSGTHSQDSVAASRDSGTYSQVSVTSSRDSRTCSQDSVTGSRDSVDEKWYCGVCQVEYCDETAETELWICCDRCDTWYHCSCEEVLCPPAEDEQYICKNCQAM